MKRSNGLTRERKDELDRFQREVGIRFKCLGLLNTALSHKSYVNEADADLENNEKLEFLGDALLGLVISDYLYNQNIYYREGSLARIKSYVVSEPALYRVGQKINIQTHLLIGKGEEKSGGRYRKALISDSVEAFIGAYYIDNGYKHARNNEAQYTHDLSRALQYLILSNTDVRLRMGKAARQRAITEYSLTAIERKIHALYDEIISHIPPA